MFASSWFPTSLAKNWRDRSMLLSLCVLLRVYDPWALPLYITTRWLRCLRGNPSMRPFSSECRSARHNAGVGAAPLSCPMGPLKLEGHVHYNSTQLICSNLRQVLQMHSKIFIRSNLDRAKVDRGGERALDIFTYIYMFRCRYISLQYIHTDIWRIPAW